MSAKIDRVLEIAEDIKHHEAEAERLRGELKKFFPKSQRVAAPKKRKKPKGRKLWTEEALTDARARVKELIGKEPRTARFLAQATGLPHARLHTILDELIITQAAISDLVVPMPDSRGRIRETVAYGRTAHLTKIAKG